MEQRSSSFTWQPRTTIRSDQAVPKSRIAKRWSNFTILEKTLCSALLSKVCHNMQRGSFSLWNLRVPPINYYYLIPRLNVIEYTKKKNKKRMMKYFRCTIRRTIYIEKKIVSKRRKLWNRVNHNQYCQREFC